MIFYTLRIHTTEENKQLLNSILGVKANSDYGWAYKVTVRDDDPYFDFIHEFYKIIMKNKKELDKLKISENDIEFWIVSTKQNQNNFEFDNDRLQKISECGATLCISVYS